VVLQVQGMNTLGQGRPPGAKKQGYTCWHATNPKRGEGHEDRKGNEPQNGEKRSEKRLGKAKLRG